MSRKVVNHLLLAAGLLVLSLLVFHGVLGSGNLLLTTDDNIGILSVRKSALPHGFFGWWDDATLVGFPGSISFNLTNLLLWLLPLKVFSDWIHAIDLALASFFLVLFLRRRGIRWSACCVGMLAAFWVGSNFTLTYAGHIGKFGVLVFASAFLWFAEMAVQSGKIRWAVLAGGALGGMFLEQQDVALFFAMGLFPYLLFALIRKYGKEWKCTARIVFPVIAVSLLIAVHPLLAGYSSAVKGVTSISEEDPIEKWNFVTQWSWPPEESIDFIAPGFMGWRSGDPSGPYWGRMGRSAGWKQTGQGFQNFKLESQYMGASAVVLIMLALFLLFGRQKESSEYSPDVRVWGIIALVALLLSFGKHFFLYRLFYLLPVVSSIRNPNKFLQVLQLAGGILAAIGMESVLRQSDAVNRGSEKRMKRFIIVLAAAGSLMLFWVLISFASWGNLVGKLSAQGWAGHAAGIVNLRLKALAYGGVVLLVMAIWLGLIRSRKSRMTEKARYIATWFVCILLVVDTLYLSRHYIQTMDAASIAENDVVKVLKDEASRSYQRAALTDQSSFYNHWLTYLFPYNGVKAINVTQMPRMPDDYKQFLGRISSNPTRYWELCAVGPVLGSASLWSQIQRTPEMKERFDIRFAYNVIPEGNHVKIIPGNNQQPGRQCILTLKKSLPRFALISGWEVSSDEQILNALTVPEHNPLKMVYISEDTIEAPLPPPAASGLNGSVTVKKYRAGMFELQVSTDNPCILRVAEKYSPDWKILLDDKPADLLRCDYLFQGVYIPSGIHWVKMKFAPSTVTLWPQLVGLLACAAAGIMLMTGKKDESPLS